MAELTLLLQTAFDAPSVRYALASGNQHEGVRVNVVCPGIIETAMNEDYRHDETSRDALNAMQPMGRLGQPEEIAAAVLYLSSPAAAFVTGTTLSVDGGIAV